MNDLSRPALLLVLLAISAGAQAGEPAPSPWPQYGGSAAGTRFTEASQITPTNAHALTEAWRVRTGDATGVGEEPVSHFKATPVLVGGKLVVSTGFNRVLALDPGTGEVLWRHDPGVDFRVRYSEMYTSRGVTGWMDPAPPAQADTACSTRIFLATLDARLIALDGDSGQRCQDFGTEGQVDLSQGVVNFRRGEYSVTTPPTVVGDVVVVGSSVGDNGGVRLDRGTVRAFDVRNGRQRWGFDPLPRAEDAPGARSWAAGTAGDTGAANVWSAMAADPARDLVFLPTTSPSPDFYGGARLGDGKYANSLVALRASTGELVWARQLVHHDLWDYDLASQPMLIDVERDGEAVAAVVLATKMGFVFVFDRETGRALHEVRERPVPASAVPGEQAAKTQPFPAIRLHPTEPDEFVRWAADDGHRERCDRQLDGVQYNGIFTPPSIDRATLLYPGNFGGANWGSMAYMPDERLAFVAVNRVPTVVRLIPRAEFRAAARRGELNGIPAQFTAQAGTPYGMARYDVYDRETGLPCQRGPWSTLVALDPASGAVRWEVPVSKAPGVDAASPAASWGYFAGGGPLAVGGGLVFLATPHNHTLAAFEAATGQQVWASLVPAQPFATPMSYRWNARQYVVVAAGGSGANGEGRGDYLLAFALPKVPQAPTVR
ncbi:MAG: PQQ-binding-like beta-propeller repeat protein [Pseudomonadota bacterium]